MQIVKCRAWDETHKEWVSYGFCLRFDEMGNCEILNAFAQPFTDRRLIPAFWTGMQDLMGRDIYEGDITKYRLYYDGEIYTDCVEYRNGAFLLGPYGVTHLSTGMNKEVIGNMYEHPMLVPVK